MKNFMDDNFILQTKTAEYLYHEHAKKMPIIDYHCHLIPQQIAENTKFDNITQPWLYGDHYKWRALRTNGVAEKYCTGDASDWEKFEKVYARAFCQKGRPGKSARLVIGALILKHNLAVSDEEITQQLAENPYLQFFVGL